jgi:hypothetical protein
MLLLLDYLLLLEKQYFYYPINTLITDNSKTIRSIIYIYLYSDGPEAI